MSKEEQSIFPYEAGIIKQIISGESKKDIQKLIAVCNL